MAMLENFASLEEKILCLNYPISKLDGIYMKKISQLVRPNIQDLIAYSSARLEIDSSNSILLDANENPYGTANRYPDAFQKELKNMLSKKHEIAPKNIFLGNGSDEIIDLLYRVFCIPSKDAILTFPPTFSMLHVIAKMNDIVNLEIPLLSDFSFPTIPKDYYKNHPNLKLILICSPNNPTGSIVSDDFLENVLNHFEGIVILDEAYIDFSSRLSWKKKIHQYKNLIVLQTMSKAMRLASARIGMAFANEEIINLLNRIKMPFNISTLNQKAGITQLKKQETLKKYLVNFQKEKVKFQKKLKSLSDVVKVYPSEANFFLVQCTDAKEIHQKLLKNSIITSDQSKKIPNCLRITIGTPKENNMLINCLNT